MNTVVLKTNRLSKQYGTYLAVNNVDMTINKGQIYGFIGQNGAGKTTLIRIITGLIHKSDGNLELLGATTETELEEARSHIGSLVETPSFYGSMTARENLEVSRLVRNIAGTDCIDEVLKLVNLTDTGKKKVKDFSLGMRQRLGIANALLGNPQFLILDEPVNGLDPMSIVEIRELLKKLNKEKQITILISSHLLSELTEIATNYGIIKEGQLIKQFSKAELEEQCQQYIEISTPHPEKAVILLEEKLGTIRYEVLPQGLIKLYDHLNEVGSINTLLSTNGIMIERIGVKGQNLEEYFVSLVGGGQHV